MHAGLSHPIHRHEMRKSVGFETSGSKTVYSIYQVFPWILQKPDIQKLNKNKLNGKLIFPLITLGVQVSNVITDSNRLLSTPERNYL